MRRALLLLAGLFFAIPAAADDAGAPKPSPVPACVRVTTQSRWVPYGYNHIVTIENGCSKAATCSVSTDVNPEKQTVEVPSTKTVEVATFMGSAASSFVASVACTLH